MKYCQPPDTMIATSSCLAPIQSLSNGDKVISFDPTSGTLREATIRVRSRFYDGPLYHVHCAGESTWCTPEHLWTVHTQDGVALVNTLDLDEGMSLPIPNGSTVRWHALDNVKTDLYYGRVYSIEVARDEHYIADGIITHNCFGPLERNRRKHVEPGVYDYLGSLI